MNKVLLLPTLIILLFTSCQKELTLYSTTQFQGLSISGKIDCPNGGMTFTPDEYSITLIDKNKVEKTTQPAIDGAYSFDNLEIGNSYSLKIVRKSNPVNVVFSGESISNYLLQTNPPTKSTLGIYAADINEDGQVDGTDMLQVRKYVLDKTINLPATLWRFYPKYRLNNPTSNPLENLQADVKNFDIVLLKLGDIDLQSCQ